MFFVLKTFFFDYVLKKLLNCFFLVLNFNLEKLKKKNIKNENKKKKF